MEALHHYQRAIDLNNLSLSQWNAGEGVGSIEFLFSAYRHCIKSFSYPNANVDGVERANFSVNAAMESSLIAMGEKQELANNMVHNGIRVLSSPEVYQNPSGANKSMVLRAIVFNLAVVHHLAVKWNAMEMTREHREIFLSTAEEFYQTGLKLQQEISSCGMYTIAILNNLAHLYAALGDSQKSQFYFCEMQSRIASLEEAIMVEYDAHANKFQQIGGSAAPAA